MSVDFLRSFLSLEETLVWCSWWGFGETRFKMVPFRCSASLTLLLHWQCAFVVSLGQISGVLVGLFCHFITFCDQWVQGCVFVFVSWVFIFHLVWVVFVSLWPWRSIFISQTSVCPLLLSINLAKLWYLKSLSSPKWKLWSPLVFSVAYVWRFFLNTLLACLLGCLILRLDLIVVDLHGARLQKLMGGPVCTVPTFIPVYRTCCWRSYMINSISTCSQQQR